MKLIISNDAIKDIESIRDYGELNWGNKQLDAYIDGLEKLFQLIVSQPAIGKAYDGSRGEYRYISYQSHQVYWCVGPKTVSIMAVISKWRLPDLHL